MLVGLFEPKAAPWSLDAIPQDLGFAVLPPDWDRMAGFLSDAMDRFPSLHDAGIRQFFCGPESFTLGQRSAARRGARAPRVLRRVRAELARHPAVGRRGLVDRAVDRRRRAAARRHGHLAGPARCRSWPRARSASRRRSSCSARCSATPRSRPGGRGPRAACRRSPIHDRLADAGADFMVLHGLRGAGVVRRPGRLARATAGMGCATSRSTRQAKEHRAVREAVGIMDMSFMAKINVQGPDALSAAQPGERERRSTCRSARSSTRSGAHRTAGSGPTSP